MIIENLQKILDRDLAKLEEELNLYKKESNLWLLEGDVKNTGGNLILHLCGNLQHFIGAILGSTSYIRKRDDEFNLRDISKSTLVESIKTTKRVVKETLFEMSEEDLSKNYPINVFGEEMTTGFFLMHLSAHLSYHLGQLNYHRRLLDN